MSGITFSCPQCAKRFDVDAALAGKKCRCKQCGHLFSIPLADQSGRAKAPVRRRSTAPPAGPADPFGVEERPLPPRRAAAVDPEEARPPGRREAQDEGRTRRKLKNPWLTIWYSPRKTLRRILKKDPERGVVLIFFLGGINSILEPALAGGPVAFTIIHWLILALIGGTVGTALNYFVTTAIFRIAGEVLGGRGESAEVRAALAWGSAPVVFMLPIRLALLLVLGGHAPHAPVAGDASLSPGPLALLVLLPFSLWALILFIACLAEAHRFSIVRAIGTMVVVLVASVVFVMVLAFVVVFIFHPK